MSADNWATCPRCLANAPDDVDLGRSFREDYEIYGAEEGFVRVMYSGNCQECHLSLTFENETPLYPNGSG